MKSPTLSEIYEYEAVLFGSSFDFVLFFLLLSCMSIYHRGLARKQLLLQFNIIFVLMYKGLSVSRDAQVSVDAESGG